MRSRNVAKELIHLIASGEVAVGDALPPTRTLASRFGVSLNTVQVALKELETLQMINCVPRQRSVVTANSPAGEQGAGRQVRQVAIIAPVPPDSHNSMELRTPWTAQIVHAMEQALFEAGYTAGLVSIPIGHDVESLLAARLDLFGETLAGALCFPTSEAASLLDELERRKLPWIAVNRPWPEFNHNLVIADHHAAGRQLGRIFAECGFEQVLLLGDNLKTISDLEKGTGFCQGYLELGVSLQGIRTVSVGDNAEADGYRVVGELLRQNHPRPQAIFATGDFLAMGAVRAIQEAGLRVPEDVSVIGATGLPVSRVFDPPLAVVVQPMTEIGRNAALLLNEMIREGVFKCPTRRIPCRLILRESLKLPEALRRKLENDEQLLEITSDESRNDTV